MSVDSGVISNGPNANFLETMYLRVALPKDYIYRPMMGVRVRESAKKLPFLPFGEDPILGITSINLLEELPEYREKMAQEKKEAEAEALAKAAAQESVNKLGGAHLADITRPSAVNEIMMQEVFLSAQTRTPGGTRLTALARKGTPAPGLGPRSIEVKRVGLKPGWPQPCTPEPSPQSMRASNPRGHRPAHLSRPRSFRHAAPYLAYASRSSAVGCCSLASTPLLAAAMECPAATDCPLPARPRLKLVYLTTPDSARIP